jgi:hypothetical protein
MGSGGVIPALLPLCLFRVTSPGSCCSLPRRKLRQAPQQGRDSERKHRAHYPNRQAGDDVQDPSSGSPADFKKSMQVFKMCSSWDGRDDQRPPIAWVSNTPEAPLQSGERSWICPAHHRRHVDPQVSQRTPNVTACTVEVRFLEADASLSAGGAECRTWSWPACLRGGLAGGPGRRLRNACCRKDRYTIPSPVMVELVAPSSALTR